MVIQYHVRLPFLKRLFRKPAELLPDDPMHETMRSFGQTFGKSRLLSKSQLKTNTEEDAEPSREPERRSQAFRQLTINRRRPVTAVVST